MIQAEKQLKYTSAFFSNNLNKQEYLTDEDLDLKPNTVEQARLEYSPLGKFFNKGLKEEDNREGLLKRIKNIEDKNEEQSKEIEDEKKFQTKIISKSKIKPPLLESIYSQEVKDRRINGYKTKKISKTLKDMEGSKIDYSKLVHRSGDFDITRFGPLSSFYFKLINGSIDINVSKLKLKEFKNELSSLKKESKETVIQNKQKRSLRKS